MSAPTREERIRAIHASLEEWGVERERRPRFCSKVEELVTNLPRSKIPGDLDISDLASTRIPKEVNAAIKFIVKNEIQDIEASMERGKTFTLVADRFDFHYAPFFCSIDRRTGESKLFLKSRFKEILHTNPSASLSPFNRFTYKRFKNSEKFLAEQWGAQPAAFEGHVWEGVVSNWMEHSGRCFNCDSEKCLRWTGGINGRCWGDVVCIECNAMFEIKSRATIEKIHQCLFQYGEVDGGNFLTFARHRRLGKKFLVLVSRQPNASGVHPVYGIEIASVGPKLTDMSFDPTDDEPFISSCMTVRCGSHTNYIKAILPPLEVGTNELVCKLYDAYFGSGKWSQLTHGIKPAASVSLDVLAVLNTRTTLEVMTTITTTTTLPSIKPSTSDRQGFQIENPTSPIEIRKVIKIVRKHTRNMIGFHSTEV